jgi:acyl carrier protein
VKAAVFQHAQRIAADVFAIPVDQITLNSSPATIENWDSLHHLNLVLAVEGEFGMQFAPEEIEQLLSIEDIVTVLEKKLRASGKTL